MTKKAAIPFVLITLACCVAPFTARAQVTWNGVSGDYNTGTNWSSGSVPATASNILINAGTVTYSSTANFTRGGNTTLAGSGALTLTNARFLAGDTAGTSSTFTLQDTAQLTTNGTYFVVAEAGTGAFVQTGGAVNSTINGGWFLSDNAGTQGSYTLSGGTLTVNDGGSNTASTNYAVHFGKNSSSDAFVVNGGTALFKATTTDVRTYISQGAKVEVDSGEATFDSFRYITIGRTAAAGTTSELLINGGVCNITNLPANGGISVGNSNAGEIVLNSGGTLNITGAAGSGLWIGDGNTTGTADPGTFIQNGGKLTLNVSIILSRNSPGTFDMYGGEIDAPSIAPGPGYTSSGLSAVFNFQGGNIFLTGDQTSIIDAPWFEGAPGTTATYNASTNLTQISVVPEPSVTALLMPMGAMVLRRRRYLAS